MADQPEQSELLRAALSIFRYLRSTQPDLVKWIEDGHPHLTDEEHKHRFGHDHPDTVRRRKRHQKQFGAYYEPDA